MKIDNEYLEKLDKEIGELHIQKIMGKIDEGQLISQIKNRIKKVDKQALAALLYYKSLAHGHQTAVSKILEVSPSPHIVGFLYNRSWTFKHSAIANCWKFILSKDPFTHISTIDDPEDPRIFTAENDFDGEMDVATADYILLKVFNAVLEVLDQQFEKEAEIEKMRRKGQ